MGQLENYLDEKRKKQAGEKQPDVRTELDIQEELNTAFVKEEEAPDVYKRQESSGMGAGTEYDTDTASYAEERIREKQEQSSFAERTEYYFRDAGYMQSKVKRYAKLASDKNLTLDVYADEHTNRSADKRKKKARAAAKSFEKARKLEEKLNIDEDGEGALAPVELYKRRDEIMRARMDGMINAAKVKATSDRNEEYRIAKAKLSCLSVLYDQAKNLLGKEHEKDFKSIESGLLKEIADAQKSLKKYGENSLEKWKDALGVNDKAHLDRMIKESGNPHATREDAQISLMFSTLMAESSRPEIVEAASHTEEVFGVNDSSRHDEVMSMIRYVKRDKNGKPINREERKKEEWNKRWLEAYSDKDKSFERKQLMFEAMDRIKDYKLPTPEELRKKGPLYFIKKDPIGIYEIAHLSLRLDNYAKCDPDIYEYYNNPLLRTKFEATKFFSLVVDYTLGFEHNINRTYYTLKKGDEKAGKDKATLADEKAEYKELINDQLVKYEEAYPRVTEAEKALQTEEASYRRKNRFKTFKDAKAEIESKNKNKLFDEKSFELYKNIRDASNFIDCPHYRTAYAQVYKKFSSDKDISRVCGSILRPVNFDKNWKPLTAADMEAHLWNMRFINNVVTYVVGPNIDSEWDEATNKRKDREARENSQKIIQEMVEEETKKYYEGQFELPSPEQLRKDLLEPLNKGEQPYSEAMENMIKDMDRLWLLFEKTLTFEGPYKNLPFLKDYYDKNPLFDKCQNMYREFCTLLIMYGHSRYHIHLNSETSLGTISGLGPDLSDKEMVDTFITMYETSYKAFHEEKNKKG
ncbi:MAG: hypothetical protein IKO61_09445 [Lachnospiraceae bacterium]|nr:hypothetical protein [Lachnospiraceae bacterium]